MCIQKNAIINAYQPENDTFVSPLKCIFNLATSKNDLPIDSTANLAKGSIYTVGNSTIGGNLTVNCFIAAKPYVSFKVSTTGGVPSTVSGSTVTTRSPGTVTITNFGINASVVCTCGTFGASNSFLHTFTWTGAHQLGANFGANVFYYTTSTSSTQPVGVITTGTSATSIGVWLRTTVGTVSNVIQDGSFYVYSVP